MNTIYYFTIFGLVGGVVRGVFGYIKELSNSNYEFRLVYFFLTVISSAIIGAIAGSLINMDWRISLLSGYVVTDILEGFYKIRFRDSLKSVFFLAFETKAYTESY